MANICFNKLRLETWLDEYGNEKSSRPLTLEEVDKVKDLLANILYENPIVLEDFQLLAEEFSSPDTRVCEIDWDQEVTDGA